MSKLRLRLALGMALAASMPIARAEYVEPVDRQPPKKAQAYSMPIINNPSRHGRPMNRQHRRAKNRSRK